MLVSCWCMVCQQLMCQRVDVCWSNWQDLPAKKSVWNVLFEGRKREIAVVELCIDKLVAVGYIGAIEWETYMQIILDDLLCWYMCVLSGSVCEKPPPTHSLSHTLPTLLNVFGAKGSARRHVITHIHLHHSQLSFALTHHSPLNYSHCSQSSFTVNQNHLLTVIIHKSSFTHRLERVINSQQTEWRAVFLRIISPDDVWVRWSQWCRLKGLDLQALST